MQFTQAIAAAVLAFSSVASAHMILENPKPFGAPNSSPLNDDGSNFPCKFDGTYGATVTSMNNWEAGSTQSISFTGSAVHGGGSCQFSFTTDKVPTKDSVWKVIHSVIGGCPKAGVKGNLADNAEGHEADKFPVTVPKDTPNGQLTFAWSWFNKVGNREMYMQCAPVTISGGVDSADALSKLPDMFVGNIPNATCLVEAETNLNYPNPGASVVSLGDPKDLGAPGFRGPGCQTAGSVTPVTPVTPSNPDNGAVTPAPAPVASSAPVVAPVPVTPAPVDPVPVTPAPASGCTPCTNNGGLICVSSTQFGICDNGCAIAQAVAAGTTCSNGAIIAMKRRSARHPHSRRHGSSMLRRRSGLKN
jgi:hypothetical protein